MRTFLVLSLFLVACAPPEVGGGEAEGVYLRTAEDDGGWHLELVNESDATLHVGHLDGYAGAPVLRIDALQETGAWEGALARWQWQFTEGGPRTVARGQSTHLVPDWHRSPLHPGTYRAAVPFERDDGSPAEVYLELTYLGWSDVTLDEALALRERAVDAGCRRVRRSMDAELTANLDPDALVLLQERVDDAWRRDAITTEMVERGGFVDHLALLAQIGSLDEVGTLAHSLAGRSEVVQPSLRHVVAQRLIDELAAAEPLDAEIWIDLSRMSDAWPDDAGARLVTRLERGPESGSALLELVNVFTYADREPLQAHGDAILAGLDRRCPELAAVEEGARACERARQRFGPDGEFTHWGRGTGGTWGCGGWGVDPPACESIASEWEELRARAGEPELVLHSG